MSTTLFPFSDHFSDSMPTFIDFRILRSYFYGHQYQYFVFSNVQCNEALQRFSHVTTGLYVSQYYSRQVTEIQDDVYLLFIETKQFGWQTVLKYHYFRRRTTRIVIFTICQVCGTMIVQLNAEVFRGCCDQVKVGGSQSLLYQRGFHL